MKFEKVAILGVGLLGGSLARDLKAKNLASIIVGVTRSTNTAQSALELGVVDQIDEIQSAVRDADLVVLATPMQAMLPVLDELSAVISPTALITDVGSVKTDLFQQVCDKHPNLLKQFVFAHPIAGGESSGVTASRLDLFDGKNVIITRTEQVKAEYVHVVESMWRAVGAEVISMSLQQHDAVFAKTSHLPHVVAFSLVNYLSGEENKAELFELAAAGFYDFTRIASSDAEMWRDICITNKEQITVALDGYISQLMEVRKNINLGKQEHILEYFVEAKSSRDAGLLNKQPKIEGKSAKA